MTTLTVAPVITYRLPYDRETHDYTCLVTIGDDPEQYIGSAETYLEAERKCRNYINDLLASDLLQSATALDGGSSQDKIAAEYAAALPTCAACHTNDHAASTLQPAFCTECVYAMLQGRKNRLDSGHNHVTPDPAECPDISAPQPVEDLPRCEQRAVAPSLALWGPDTPECERCGQRHDPVVACPVRCANCDKPHHIQRCPEVWRALLG